MEYNLFDLTSEQEDTSKMMYKKVIKCLIAPYHTYSQLESMIPYDKNTFLFPEREMTLEQTRSLINILASKPTDEEFRIVTTDMSIVCDMVDTSVRILTAQVKLWIVHVKHSRLTYMIFVIKYLKMNHLMIKVVNQLLTSSKHISINF